MKLIINILLFIFIFILNSCTINKSKQIVNYSIEKKQNMIENTTDKKNTIDKVNIQDKENIKNEDKIKLNNYTPTYLVENSYFIEGVQHTPLEDYKYNKKGLATFYGKDLHNKRTLNNELNKVTELLGRHKTLPLPSVVKITNLENGLSLIIRVNDRNTNNSSIIEVSRKVAQLLRFYKAGIARVRVEIMPDASKQVKIVTETMNDPNFNLTLDSSPTPTVLISDLGETEFVSNKIDNTFEQPIELGFEQVTDSDLFISIDGFDSYNEIQNIIQSFENNYKTTIQNEGDSYSAIFGPLNNAEVNKLVQFFISKGYKNTEIIIK